MLAALVAGPEVIEAFRSRLRGTPPPTSGSTRSARPPSPWRGRFDRAGAAVTGHGFARGDGPRSIRRRCPCRPTIRWSNAWRCASACRSPLANDAQAAAWGEYRFGAGQGRDIVFLTVSTGIGGGIVAGGRLLTGRGGVAGHVGQSPRRIDRTARESWRTSPPAAALAAAAAASGHDWRRARPRRRREPGRRDGPRRRSRRRSRPLARACVTLQMLIDPDHSRHRRRPRPRRRASSTASAPHSPPRRTDFGPTIRAARSARMPASSALPISSQTEERAHRR